MPRTQVNGVRYAVDCGARVKEPQLIKRLCSPGYGWCDVHEPDAGRSFLQFDRVLVNEGHVIGNTFREPDVLAQARGAVCHCLPVHEAVAGYGNGVGCVIYARQGIEPDASD